MVVVVQQQLFFSNLHTTLSTFTHTLIRERYYFFRRSPVFPPAKMADPVLSPVAHLHIIKVNLTLTSSLAAMAIGAYLDRHFNTGLATSFTGFYLAIIWGFFARETWKEALVYCGFMLFMGNFVNSATQLVYEVDRNFVVILCLGAASSTSCFLAAAILTSRKAYLYTTALLSSSLSALIWLQFASSVFGGSSALFKYQNTL